MLMTKNRIGMKVKTRDREIKLRYSKTSDEVENSSLDKLFNKKMTTEPVSMHW